MVSTRCKSGVDSVSILTDSQSSSVDPASEFESRLSWFIISCALCAAALDNTERCCLCIIVLMLFLASQYFDLITFSWGCRFTTLFKYHFSLQQTSSISCVAKRWLHVPCFPLRNISRSSRIHFLKSCYSIQQLSCLLLIWQCAGDAVSSAPAFLPLVFCQIASSFIAIFPCSVCVSLRLAGADALSHTLNSCQNMHYTETRSFTHHFNFRNR